ncbi:hypothetical protein ACIQNK_34915 [Streptomyces sp. NPDC091273]|uniref:hypothetical protein n=1 Tax=Streptomyces sp. NPDC091273 TaxID=3365982 RepID=UPI0037F7B4E4
MKAAGRVINLTARKVARVVELDGSTVISLSPFFLLKLSDTAEPCLWGIVMPLVFVHGVANRMSDQYESAVRVRDALFRRYLLTETHTGQESISIHNPYWGGFGAQLHWGGASLPVGDYEAFGTAVGQLGALAAPMLPDSASLDTPLISVARQSLSDAVDLIWAAAGTATCAPEDASRDDDALAGESVRVLAYCRDHESPQWLNDLENDDEFLQRLAEEVEAYAPPPESASQAERAEWEAFGGAAVWNRLQEAAAHLRGAVINFVGQQTSERLRPAIMPPVATFLGDAFIYLREQDSADRPIADVVEAALRRAAAEKKNAEDPLIVVGHSMGGNIAYDLLASKAADLRVNLFVTVGSQVGLFEELKLFTASDKAIPTSSSPKVERLPNIDRWINTFDYNDMLGFSIALIMDGTHDFAYRTKSLLHAHSAYFHQPKFHERLAVRAKEAAP